MASTRPVAPTARASGTVHSPRLAPMSTATAPGRRKPRAAGWARGGCSSACRPRASSGRGTLTRSPVRWRTKPPGQSRSSRVSRRFSRHRLTRRAPGGSGSPGGRSFQSALRRAIMARRSPGPLRRCLMSMFDLTGRVDVVVNNAGTSIRKPPQGYTAAEWHAVLDTNLTGAFLCSQAAHGVMKGSGGGKIINIGSMFALFGSGYAAPYAASKGALVQLTKSLAVAWAGDNIQVNAILPGWIDTELTRDARRQVVGLHERVLARTPIGRWGAPEDLSGIAVFLASAASDFITGAAVPVDGGYSAMG